MTVPEAANFLNITSQAIVKKLKSKNLDFEKVQNRIYFGYNSSKKIFDLKTKPVVIATQIVKGGTGKSSITMNLAIRANLYGLKVLCIDLDQQANLTELFGFDAVEDHPIMLDVIESDGKIKIENNLIEITQGLHLFPSRLDNAALDDTILLKGLGIDRVYKELIAPLKSYYDVIFIDCPPALGRSVTAAAYASDKIIAPVAPDRLCLTGLRLLHETLEEIKESKYGREIPYEIVYNKFDSRTSLSKEVLSTLLTHPIYKDKMNLNYIRQSQEFPNSAAIRTSVFDTFKSTAAKEDIDLLLQNLLDINKKPSETNEAPKISVVSISTKKIKKPKQAASKRNQQNG
ncbi:MAG: ParA family protein [Flavobacteriales bacterium]|nr:ParA family protein [Flavobacteriales bacterium]